MPVAAGVVLIDLGTAMVAAGTVAAEGGSAAAGNSTQCLVLHTAQRVHLAVVRAMGADDIAER